MLTMGSVQNIQSWTLKTASITDDGTKYYESTQMTHAGQRVAI